MGEDAKEELVREICGFASCAHRRCTPQKPGFVDWYLILRADEDAGSEAIRRRYRQLALQLHPDKNKHPKAEVAFKLISEAYKCLMDKARRKAFNLERRKYYCEECHRQLPSIFHRKHDDAEKQRGYNDAEQTNTQRVQQALKEARNRFRKECRVVDSCLRANEASGQEFPLFNPSDSRLFPDYPHHRSRLFAKTQNYWYFHASHVINNCSRREVQCESPIYEIKSKSRRSRSRNCPFTT